MSDSTDPPRVMRFSPDSELMVSEDDLRDLFPRSVRPVVIGSLWVLLVALLIVFGALALTYGQMAG